LLTLINDILDFSKIEAGKIELEEVNFNIKELVENVIVALRPKAMEKDLIIKVNINEQGPRNHQW
jgi:signal transduction histidine kinase